MSDKQIALAAERLFAAWKHKITIPSLPNDLSPSTRAEAYAIQDRLADKIGAPVMAWKVGGTTENARKAGGHDGLLPGRIFDHGIMKSGDEIDARLLSHGKVEAEIALCLTEDLPDYGRAYVADDFDGILTMHCALELVASRYIKGPATSYDLIADNGNSAALVVGPALDSAEAIDPMVLEVTLTIAGKETMNPANLFDENRAHPLAVMVEFANLLKNRKIGLKKGQYVSTGTMTVPAAIQKGDKISADFAGLCHLECSLK